MAYLDSDGAFGSVALATAGLRGGLRIAFRIVSPNVGFLKHAGAAARIFGAPITEIEAANNRRLTPRYALAHHYAGAVWPFVFRFGLCGAWCRLAPRPGARSL